MNMLKNTSGAVRQPVYPFGDAEWNQVLNHLADVIGPEAHRYAKVPAAQAIAAIGYLSGSEDPDRFAVSNLLTFHGATKARKLFNHRASDDGDVLRRLATIQFGASADPEVVAYGMTLLALISLGDHEHDQADDARIGKYNPVTAGKWDAKALRRELEAKLEGNVALKANFASAVSTAPTFRGYWM